MAVFGANRKKKSSNSVPEFPILDALLTFALLSFGLVTCVYFALDGDLQALSELALAMICTVFAMAACKFIFPRLGRIFATEASLAKPRNLRKFGDQSWQLVIHVCMTAYELQILEANKWRWWADRTAVWSEPWQFEAGGNGRNQHDLKRLSLMQLGIWFVTAFSHKFVEARHKDYFVMYSHHVVTILLVLLSLLNAWTPIGLTVLLIHDSSDIIADLLKMVNYLGLESARGFFLVEILFGTNLLTWAYGRLWIFPSFVLRSVFIDYPRPLRLFGFGNLCRGLLLVLQCMHIWWFFLFLRILYKITQGSTGHDAGREDYEGTSDSEAEEGSASAADERKQR